MKILTLTRQFTGLPGCWKQERPPSVCRKEVTRLRQRDMGLADPEHWKGRCGGISGVSLYRNARMFCASYRSGDIYVNGPLRQFALYACQAGEERTPLLSWQNRFL